MGFLLICAVLSVVVLSISIRIHNASRSEIVHGISFAGVVFSIFGIALPAIGIFLIGVDVLYKDVNIKKAETNKNVLVRMLNEDYNSENLRKALEFNEKMNVCKFKQQTKLWKYFETNGACIDTIDIPNGKFVPTQQIRILTDSVGN